jgi:hypothetical protein
MALNRLRHDVLQALSTDESLSAEDLQKRFAQDSDEILHALSQLYFEQLIGCESNPTRDGISKKDLLGLKWRRLPGSERAKQSMEQHEWET